MRTHGEKVQIQNVADLLKANIGKRVTITTSLEDNPTFTGSIKAVTPQDDQADDNPYVMGGSSSVSAADSNDGTVLLKTDKGVVALQKSVIAGAEFKNDKVTTTCTKKVKRPSLRMELEKRSNGETVKLSYLAGGITWSPSYRIDLSDPKQALFSAKAVVINEVTDLEGVDIDLVTGFPNVKYSSMVSPVSMAEKLSGYLDALGGGGRSSGRRGRRAFAFTNQSVYGYLDNPPPVYMPDESARAGSSRPETGAVSEDLFLYPVRNIDIKRNETACIPLFSMNVPYEHIYIWNVKDYLAKDDYYNRDSDREDERDTVWHVARLTNTSKVPWTTAPCEFIKNGQITGQDICYYTPVGAKATVHINHAINISTEQSELEIKRSRRAKTFHGREYDLVTIEGCLNINSRLDKIITIEISKLLKGTVLKTEPEADDFKIAKGLKKVNTNHKLVWSLDLKPGKEKKLTYTYEVYVRD
jgi:hypothetical protein